MRLKESFNSNNNNICKAGSAVSCTKESFCKETICLTLRDMDICSLEAPLKYWIKYALTMSNFNDFNTTHQKYTKIYRTNSHWSHLKIRLALSTEIRFTLGNKRTWDKIVYRNSWLQNSCVRKILSPYLMRSGKDICDQFAKMMGNIIMEYAICSCCSTSIFWQMGITNS
jgi:recombinational DNA repair protein RecR